MRDTIQRLYDCGADEIHMRPACPPLLYGCKFLNFSRSRSEMDLATRKAMRDLAPARGSDASAYAHFGTPAYDEMEEWIRCHLDLTTLKYQALDDLVAAIGLPKEKLCTYCWDGEE